MLRLPVNTKNKNPLKIFNQYFHYILENFITKKIPTLVRTYQLYYFHTLYSNHFKKVGKSQISCMADSHNREKSNLIIFVVFYSSNGLFVYIMIYCKFAVIVHRDNPLIPYKFNNFSICFCHRNK